MTIQPTPHREPKFRIAAGLEEEMVVGVWRQYGRMNGMHGGVGRRSSAGDKSDLLLPHANPDTNSTRKAQRKP